MLVYYKISYSKHFIGDKSYWIYNLMQIHFIISLFLKYLIKLLKERKRLIEEKAGFPSHLLNVLYMVWMMLFLNFWGCYWLYIPKKTLDISNAPTPYVLYTYEYKYKHMDSLVGNTSRTIVIEDDKLLEDFTRELS
jgi:hypothetical protein